MKLYRAIIFLLLIFSASIFSQDFDVWVENERINGNLGEELIFNIEVENLTLEDITLSIVREKNDIPQQWSSSLCFSICFAPFIDSITTTSEFGSSPISPGEIRDLSLHVFPLGENGLGEIEIAIENLNNSDSRTVLLFTASTVLTSVENQVVPDKFELKQNYPNPFNPTTMIKYSIPVSSRQYAAGSQQSQSFNQPITKSNGELVSVQLKVYDILGREVAILVDKKQNAGNYTLKFDASTLPSGIYLYELKTSEFRSVRKMVLEK